MEKIKKETKEKVASGKVSDSCGDKLCPIHGKMGEKLKLRGRTFEGEVIRKFHGRVTIEFERALYLRKYERYEKRRTKIHARLPSCMDNDVDVGDRIEIAETRPISKTMHFVVTRIVRKGDGNDQENVEEKGE